MNNDLKKYFRIFCAGYSCILCMVIEIAFVSTALRYLIFNTSIDIEVRIRFLVFGLVLIIFQIFISHMLFLYKAISIEGDKKITISLIRNYLGQIKPALELYGKIMVFVFIAHVAIATVATVMYPKTLKLLDKFGVVMVGDFFLLSVLLVSGLTAALLIQKIRSKIVPG